MKYLAFIMSISLLVILTFSQCGDDELELTKDKIEGTWIEITPCVLNTRCDTLIFTSSDQFSTSYGEPLSTYNIIAQDTLQIITPNGTVQNFFIEFSNNNQELKIHSFFRSLVGNEDVYYQK